MTHCRSLSWIHAILTLLIPVFVLAVGGCANEDTDKIDYGPPVERIDVARALYGPLQESDPLDIQVGQFVHFANIQQINTGTPVLLSDTGQIVVDRKDDETKAVFSIVEHRFSYDGRGNRRQISREHEVWAEKSTPEDSVSALPKIVAGGEILAGVLKLLKGAEAAPRGETVQPYAELDLPVPPCELFGDQKRITYHNLRVATESVSLPTRVQERPNCLDFPSCEITIHRIQFDQVVWTGGEGQKIACDYEVAPSAPYLAQTYKHCFRLMFPVEKTKVLLRQCTNVEDFAFTTETPSETAESVP